MINRSIVTGQRLSVTLGILICLVFTAYLAYADFLERIEREWFLRGRDPETLNRLKEIRLDEGAWNIEEISAALAKEGYSYLSQGEPDLAIRILQSAKELSPDYPPAYYATGKAYWQQSYLNIFKTLDEFLSGWRATLRNFWWLFMIVGNLSLTLILTIVGSLFLFSTVMAIHYVPILNHDIKEKVPKIPSFIFNLIFIGLFLLLLFKAGFIWLYPFLLFILWPYLRVKEKGISFISLILLAFLPSALTIFSSISSAQGSTELKAIVQANKECVGSQGLKEMEEWVNKDPNDYVSIFSLALEKKKRGNFDEALTLYHKIIDEKSISDRVLNNMGNIYAIKRDLGSAAMSYNEALKKNPNLISVHYNLSQLYRESFRFDEGEKEYRKAKEIDSELLKFYSSIKGTSFNRCFIDESLRNWEIWKKALRHSKEREALAESVWAGFMKGIPLKRIPYPLLFIFLGLITYHFLARKSLSYYCIKCGKIVCKRCDGHRKEEGMCDQCYKVLIQLDGTSKDRIDKILELRRFQDKRNSILKVMAFFPGLRDLYEGYLIKGMVFIFCFLGGAIWWFLWDYLKTPFKIYPSILGPARLGFLLVFVSLYLYVVLVKGRIRLLR